LGCAGIGGGTSGAGELDFTGQTVPQSFYLDFAAMDGILQGGVGIVVYDVTIWQSSAPPAVTLVPPVLLFPGPGAMLPVSVTNSGGSTVNIASIPLITGFNSNDFAVLAGTTCVGGMSLSPGDSCVVDVLFKPITDSAESASLAVFDNVNTSPQMVALAGGAPLASIGPNPIPESDSPQLITIVGDSF